jgi:hypothetical protein
MFANIKRIEEFEIAKVKAMKKEANGNDLGRVKARSGPSEARKRGVFEGEAKRVDKAEGFGKIHVRALSLWVLLGR